MGAHPGPSISRSRLVRARRDLRLALACVAAGELALGGEAAGRGARWLDRGGRLTLDAPSAQAYARLFAVVAAGTAAVAEAEALAAERAA